MHSVSLFVDLRLGIVKGRFQGDVSLLQIGVFFSQSTKSLALLNIARLWKVRYISGTY